MSDGVKSGSTKMYCKTHLDGRHSLSELTLVANERVIVALVNEK